MDSRAKDQTIALAGIFQAAMLAQQLAREGAAEPEYLRASIRSVLVIDALNVVSVFGGTAGVRLGLTGIAQKMGNRVQPSDMEVARYVMNMVQLQSKLKKSDAMINQLGRRLEQVGSSDGALNELGEDLFRELASIYSDTISRMAPRIIVQGEPGYLNNQLIVNQVRSVLLSGIRAAYLWGQLGGHKFHLLMKRRFYLAEAGALLENN